MNAFIEKYLYRVLQLLKCPLCYIIFNILNQFAYFFLFKGKNRVVSFLPFTCLNDLL